MGALKEAWEFINWDDKNAQVSKYFKVHEVLYLPSWAVYHIPSREEKRNIWALAQQMDEVRELVGTPIKVHVWIRPVLNNPSHQFHGSDYNKFITKNPDSESPHKTGRAVVWSNIKMDCDKVRKLLKPYLKRLNLRMEDLPGSNWVHNDNMPVGYKRFFRP